MGNLKYDMAGLKAFPLSKVTLLDKTYINAFEKETDYLKSFDTDRLLAGFRETAGLDMKGKKRYEGWEDSLIGGHTMGHYMAALSNAFSSANSGKEDKKILLGLLKELTYGLRDCQAKTGTGFIFGATVIDKDNIEKQFDNVEISKANIEKEAWVPWYTMHKIFEGLVAAANIEIVKGFEEEASGLAKTALKTLGLLADWVYERTERWSEETARKVLNIEYGGMNDVLYDTFLLTGKKEHLKAAHAFDEESLFERVFKAKDGDDVLNDIHANTTIPKFMGALKRYVVTGEKKYLEYAKAFWNTVTRNHTYITGGNSEWEHFGRDGILNKERTNCNNETCNVYNMLKLTKLLYEISGDGKYADYMENAQVNSIMSSQNPETGMTTYFQPMASGYFKVYSDRYTRFWCCTGTGMENFSKLQESFYFKKNDMLIINRYVSSSLCAYGIEIEQRSDIPFGNTVHFEFKKDYTGKLAFRLPDWLAGEAEFEINEKSVTYRKISSGGLGSPERSNGYAMLSGEYKKGFTIDIKLPMEVRAYSLPDSEDTYAFKYGPVVLSALLGSEDMETSETGVIVTIPAKQVIKASYIPSGCEEVVVYKPTVKEYIKDINKYLVRDKDNDKLSFSLLNCDSHLTYVTHYSQYKERYGIYLSFRAGRKE
ncbi:MAG: glycoside hydrolase family 127 protein [Lachnospiraceae bacterium]|nr:glycoside hydrolase family 127 protein [Lachnospiraceae bacterium]